MIVNATNQTIKLKEGCVVGRADAIPELDLVTTQEFLQVSNKKSGDIDAFTADVNAPEVCISQLTTLIKKNVDLFATRIQNWEGLTPLR